MLVAVSLGVGILLGILMLRNLDIGETWHDWRLVETPRWFIAGQVVLVAVFVLGIIGTGYLKPVLLGIPVGANAIFFIFGINRLRRRTDEEKRIDVEIAEELEEPTSWRLTLALALFGAVGFAVATALTGGSGGELVLAAVLGAAFGALYNLFSDAVERWFGRRGL